MSDVTTVEAFITECLATPEEAGGASMVGLTVKTATGANLALHAISAKSGGAWGKPREMAEAFWSVATRYASGVASPGGAIQFS